ncbi:molecular chaperone DnaK, partial [Akkermansiaceae bacterium]|nr:molecular chaperone DnaK [Akkermansiaceae bacterium]
VEMALEQVGDTLDEDELVAVTKAKLQVEEAIAGGKAAPLKAAVEALDAATESMATLLLEKASGALFFPAGD